MQADAISEKTLSEQLWFLMTSMGISPTADLRRRGKIMCNIAAAAALLHTSPQTWLILQRRQRLYNTPGHFPAGTKNALRMVPFAWVPSHHLT